METKQKILLFNCSSWTKKKTFQFLVCKASSYIFLSFHWKLYQHCVIFLVRVLLMQNAQWFDTKSVGCCSWIFGMFVWLCFGKCMCVEKSVSLCEFYVCLYCVYECMSVWSICQGNFPSTAPYLLVVYTDISRTYYANPSAEAQHGQKQANFYINTRQATTITRILSLKNFKKQET